MFSFHFGRLFEYVLGSKQISKNPNKIGDAQTKCHKKICVKLNP